MSNPHDPHHVYTDKCEHERPPERGYGTGSTPMDDARAARGEKQVWCRHCKRWIWSGRWPRSRAPETPKAPER